MSLIAEHANLLVLLACLFGFFMAYGIGANDVANAMGTSVGSKALTVVQAIIIAIIFEFAGAYLAGGEVTSTIRGGIIDSEAMAGSPEFLVFGMLAALLAAGTWLIVASFMGWPVSTTHSIIGAIVGFAIIHLGTAGVHWPQIWTIMASWVISPLLAGTVSYLLFRSVYHLILNTDNPFENAKRYVPIYMFLTGFLIAMVTMLKGLKHIGLDLTYGQSILWAIAIGIIVMGIGILFLRTITDDPSQNGHHRFAGVERTFAVLMIFTACAMAFAHGSNDVANAVGPLAAIVSVIGSGGDVGTEALVPNWVLLLGGLGIALGLATYGFKVMGTIGKKITLLTPSRGFAAELAAAGTVVLASGTGLPISTTHTLVGAVLGVGLARGISALNLNVVGTVVVSWVVTLPAGAGLSMLFFLILKGAFGA
ncbi:MAG: inorganic phosphate transporter [Natronospirillum sp.]